MRERPVRIEKIAVLRAAARPAAGGESWGGAMPSARAGALAVGSTDTWGVMLRGAPAASPQRAWAAARRPRGRPRAGGVRGRTLVASRPSPGADRYTASPPHGQ